MKRIIFWVTVVIVYASWNCVAKSNNVRPLYWRDYNGTAPENAYVASNVSGKIKYIGRALVDGGITIVEIIPGETTFYGPMNGVKKATINETVIEILCDGHFNTHWVGCQPSYYNQMPKWRELWTIAGKEFKKKDNVYYVGKLRDRKTKEETLGKIIEGGRLCYVLPGNKKTNCTDNNMNYLVLAAFSKL